MSRHHPPLSIRSLCIAMGVACLLGGCATPVASNGPTASDPADAAAAYTRLGKAYLAQDNLARAQQALEHALELSPDDSEALEGLALLYQRQNETSLADTFFRRALSADPDATRIRNNYAAILYGQQRYAEACTQLRVASDDITYTNRAQLFANLGQCELANGDPAAARNHYERALDIDPRNARGLLALARIEHTQGNDERAWERLQRYFTVAGTDAESLRLAGNIASAQGETARAAFYRQQLDGS
ncbi:type IV pilus biogenesis/stability protein PilW [Salinicola avicenniae]|uniref:type IV pilus biogenesis/stability protein PilW n=1 Tax=Salinicola avicenniae TaxID=2916836 RepID=UPI002072AFFA|nr:MULTISPECIES: type IV pilus biogenesis/stability protein PilW [unclassified Salinicola]